MAGSRMSEQTPLLLRSKRRSSAPQNLLFQHAVSSDDADTTFTTNKNNLQHECTCGTHSDAGIWLSNSDMAENGLVAFVWVVMLGTVGYTLMAPSSNSPTTRFLRFLLSTTCPLALACHAKTLLTDPGSIPDHGQEEILPLMPPPPHSTSKQQHFRNQHHKYCSICQIPKPPLAHHCRVCRRCIARMDHHCPWVRNCVGAGNTKHFVLFLVYSIVSGSLVLWQSLHFTDTTATFVLWCIVVPALCFVSYVLWNMWDTIMTGMGSIDRLQQQQQQGGTIPRMSTARTTKPPGGGVARAPRLPELFGTQWAVAWLPIDPVFADPEQVLQYTTVSSSVSSLSKRKRMVLHNNGLRMQPHGSGPNATAVARAFDLLDV